ncbi:MAG: 1-acyl-sn-glycerol-3-phosphate acyltransferase [Planctomycetota bacterium]|jgi:1-acyl-sn-glycerol-3-phosphate acyltransferase|nr:1-acyl-sn-glycerol-3-phosphate acyltransferase [Planctomycetota bacterium]
MAWKSFYLAAGVVSTLALPLYGGSSGENHLPDGPTLVAACHTSFLDGPLIALAYARTKLRPLHMIAYSEPFRHWLMGWILRSGGAIPFSRGDRVAQGGMLTQALGWLAAGEAVGIFPEAHINPRPTLGRPRRGMALLALESGLPVTPAVVDGSSDLLPLAASWPRWGKLARVRFGPPVRLSPQEADYASLPQAERRVLLGSLTGRVMRALSELSGRPLPG